MGGHVVARYLKPGDPYIRVRLSNGRIIGEHRFLIEKKLGRRLRRSEHVHHKDGNKRNNRLSNLELKSASAHSRAHHKPAKSQILKCPACDKEFVRTVRYIKWKKAIGTQYLYCGRTCRVPRFGKAIPPRVHGSLSGYGYWGCRCLRCKAKKAKAYLERKHKGAGRQ